MIHPDDPVAHSGKFIWLYKRAAHAVVVTLNGDLIVRPSHVEASIMRVPGGSIARHLLTRYARTFAGIVRGQFRGKGRAGDRAAMQRLLEGQAHVRLVLRTVGAMPCDPLDLTVSEEKELDGAVEADGASAADRNVATGDLLCMRHGSMLRAVPHAVDEAV